MIVRAAQAEMVAVCGGVPRPNASYRGVLLVKGLPFGADPDRIASFFKDYRLASPRHAVFIIAQTTGKPSGNAYVVFESEEEAVRARVALVHALFGCTRLCSSQMFV